MRCPICAKKNAKYIFSQGDKRTKMPGLFKLFHCGNCQTEFITPPINLSDYYESDYFFDFQDNENLLFRMKKKIIKEKYKPTNNIISNKVFHFLGSFISALPSKIGKVLDFGCSCGEILYLLKKTGFDVYGMDISKIAVEKCHSHGLNNVSLGVEKDLNIYADNFFDSIRASHVIEHMVDPKIFIKLAYKKIKKGGELVIQTPNINSLGVLFGKYTKYYYDIPRHIILFSSSSIRYLLNKNGFKNVEISYLNFFGDQVDNLYIYLENKNPQIYRIFCLTPIKLIIRLLFTPIEIILSCIGYSQTMTVIATKKIGNIKK